MFRNLAICRSGLPGLNGAGVGHSGGGRGGGRGGDGCGALRTLGLCDNLEQLVQPLGLVIPVTKRRWSGGGAVGMLG